MATIYTGASLQAMSLVQLRALERQIQRELVLTDAGSPERSQALAKLSQLERAIALRSSCRPTL